MDRAGDGAGDDDLVLGGHVSLPVLAGLILSNPPPGPKAPVIVATGAPAIGPASPTQVWIAGKRHASAQPSQRRDDGHPVRRWRVRVLGCGICRREAWSRLGLHAGGPGHPPLRLGGRPAAADGLA